MYTHTQHTHLTHTQHTYLTHAQHTTHIPHTCTHTQHTYLTHAHTHTTHVPHTCTTYNTRTSHMHNTQHTSHRAEHSNTFLSGGMEEFSFRFGKFLTIEDLLDCFESKLVIGGEFGMSVDTRWYLYYPSMYC